MKKLMNDFESYLVYEKVVSPHTHKNYMVDLSQFFSFLDRSYAEIARDEISGISKVDANVVRQYLASMVKGKSPSSMARKLASLRTFFNYCLRQELVSGNPAKEVATPKVPKKIPKFLTVDEVFALLDSPENTEALGSRDKAIMELLYGSGVRVGELVLLDIEDIDLLEGTVKVMGKGRKERIVPIGGKATAALDSYLKLRNALAQNLNDQALFINRRGGRLTARSVERMLNKYIGRCGLQKKVTPHILRHTFATHLLGSGADMRGIQELLGHASLSTTQKYTHVGIENLMKTYDKAHPKA